MMALGPGVYDDACTKAREETGGEGVLLIVIRGTKGTGFSCQATPHVTAALPDVLEDVAAQIRRDGLAVGVRGK